MKAQHPGTAYFFPVRVGLGLGQVYWYLLLLLLLPGGFGSFQEEYTVTRSFGGGPGGPGGARGLAWLGLA